MAFPKKYWCVDCNTGFGENPYRVCPICGGHVSDGSEPIPQSAKAKRADDLQRREYAKAALTGIAGHIYGPERRDNETNPQAHARWSFEVADAMLIEQHKREGGQ
jgi:hypothetical protein